MAGTQGEESGLQLVTLFGFNSDVSSNLHFIDETTVVYPVGHTVVTLNTETKKQSFVSGSSHGAALPDNGITAIALSPNKKFVAIAERGEKQASIMVHEVNSEKRRKKRLVTTDVQSKEFVWVQFSPDGKSLLALGGAPDWCLVNWQWEKARVMQLAQAVSTPSSPLYSATYCPSEPSLVCVSGPKMIKFFKIEQNDFKLLQCNLGKGRGQNAQENQPDYLCHCWAHAWDSDRRLLVGTDNGDILIFEGNEFKGAFEHPHEGPVFSIATFSKGFVIGQSNGTLVVFEKADEKDLYKGSARQGAALYKEANKLTVHKHPGNLINLAVSPSEESLVVITDTNQAMQLNLSQVEVMKDDANDPNFTPFLTPSHSREITGLDHCIRKSLIVTCGMDRTVRVWNWHEKKISIQKTFPQDPLCVAMHPAGLQILVGFSDRVRLMNLLMDDIRTFKEFAIKGCREARFSNGGQYFAAVNGSTIQVYNTYTCANLFNLRAHTAKVLSVFWGLDDGHLVSGSLDSSVLEWDLSNTTRTQEHQHKGCAYSSAITDSSGSGTNGGSAGEPKSESSNKTIYCVGNDSSLKIVQNSQLKKIVELPVVLTQLAATRATAPDRILVAGTKAGFLQAFTLPLKSSSKGHEVKPKKRRSSVTGAAALADPKAGRLDAGGVGYREFQCHSKAVTRLCMSHDDSMVFSASEDGSVAVWARSFRRGKKDVQHMGWAEEILVTKSDIAARMAEMKRLQKTVEDLQLHNEYEIRMKEMNYKEKLREVVERFKQELGLDCQKYRGLKDARDEMKRKYEGTLSSLATRHDGALSELDEYHSQKIAAEHQRFTDLERRLEASRARFKAADEQREKQYHQEITSMEEEYEQKMRLEEDHTEQLKTEEAAIRKEFEERKILIEDDAEREVSQLKTEYDNILKLERAQTLELRGNNGMLKREFAGLQQKIKNGNDKMQKSLDEQRALVGEIKRLEKDITGYEREIGERDSTIKEKDKMIGELRKKNQELAKFKFVLDYKIHELDRQIKPREQTIKEIADQIEEMRAEAGQYKQENMTLGLEMRDLKLRLGGLQKEEASTRKQVGEAQSRQAVYQIDLEGLRRSNVIKTKRLKKAVFSLFVPSAAGHGKLEGEQSGSLDDSQRQRSYLERTIQSLERKMEKDSQLHKKELLRLYRENVTCLLDCGS